MFEQASTLRRWTLVGAVLAGLGYQGPVAWAGEKVTFSDTDRRPTLPDANKRDTGRSINFENPFTSFGSRGGSLNGVTARPFAPSTLMTTPQTTPLTKRELDLLNERRNWILQRPDGGKLGETDADKAFGVDDFGGKSAGKSNSTLDNDQGDLVRYYKSLEDRSGADAATPGQDALKNTVGSLGNQDSRSESLGATPANPFAEPTGLSTLSQPRDSAFDSLRSPTAAQENGWLTKSLREINASANRGVAGGLDTVNGAPAKDLSGMAMVLGQSPIASPIAASPISKLDPLSTYPDSTREALNPVIGQSLDSKKSPLQPAFTASEKFDKALRLPPSTALQGLGASMLAPSASRSIASPLAQPRSLSSTKVQFELPKRSF